MADQVSKLPVVDAADGIDGAAAPSVSIQIGGKDPNGNLQSVLTDINGALITSSRLSLTPSSPTAATIGITSSTAVAFNASRRGLVLINTSNNRISIGLGVAGVLNSGITLYPGGTFVMDDFTYTTASINAIASIAGSNLTIQEFT